MPEIFILSGPDLGRSYSVDEGAILGRDASCAVTLRERSVSRRHAKLEREDGLWILVDMKSRNGCFVDDVKIDRARLRDGQGFRLGEQQLRFREQETEGAVLMDAPPPAAEPQTPVEAPQSPTGAAQDDDVIDEDIEFELDAPATSYPDASSPSDIAQEIDVEFGDEIDLGDEAPASAPPAENSGKPSDGLTFAAGGGVGAAPKPRPKPKAPSESKATPKKAPRAQATAGQERLARERASLAATSVTNRSASVGGVGVREGSDRVLQYNRKVDAGGFMAADLGQYPAWVRYLAYALVVAIALAVAYFSFQGMGILKKSGTTEILEEES